jgi:hypothetical protein
VLDGTKLKSLNILLAILIGQRKKLKNVLNCQKLQTRSREKLKKNQIKVLVAFLIFVFLYEFVLIIYINSSF